ncbi:MAG: pyridoxal-phosphate dependent enzyme [Anaerolineales bacterium]|nr:pyridoxal-phosphate dependent enzyme [Anaerolineales bacterium]
MIVYCPTSSFRCPAEYSPLRCPLTRAPLEYDEIPAFDVQSVDARETGIWRYAAMLPVIAAGQKRVTLGEGWTPLVHDEWAGMSLQWKIDALMPTGSYKDRGVCVMVNWLKGQGYEVLVDDSSGNAGASLACYAGRAGLRSIIYVPHNAPEPKRPRLPSTAVNWSKYLGRARKQPRPPKPLPRIAAKWPTPRMPGILPSCLAR